MRFSRLLVALSALLLGSLLTPLTSDAQKITYFDSVGHPVKERKAWLLKEQVKIDDSRWEFNTYRIKGPRLMSIQTLDKEGLIPNGRYIHYGRNGICDTLGQYINGHKEGHWETFLLGGQLVTQLEYHTDTLVDERDLAHITGIYRRPEIGAAFPGGPPSWLQFLYRTLRYPESAVTNGIMGISAVSFLVMTDGSINQQEVYVFRSSIYSFDQAAVNVIRQSPKWVPALQDGKQILSYKTVPIDFRRVPIGSPLP